MSKLFLLIFSLCEFGHSGMLIVWYLCSVPNLVQISIIDYSHWDRCTYASGIHLMTSSKLTSDSTFGHVVISAWPWCIFPSLSNPELLIFFQNSRWRPPPSWICFGETWDHPRCLIHGAYFLQKSCHDRLGSFQVIRISIFSRSGLEVLFTPPKFQFWGILPP